MRRSLRGLSVAVIAASVICVLAAMAAWWVPAFDSLRIVSPYAAVVILGLAVLGRGLTQGVRWAVLPVAMIGIWPVVDLTWPVANAAPTGATLRLLQHNLYYKNPATDLTARLGDFDIATLQETRGAKVALSALPSGWTVITCAVKTLTQTAVVSRFPALASGCLTNGEAWMRVATPGGDVTIVSLHLVWPWPAGGNAQARQVARLSSDIAALPGPMIVGGDFNQMPWSAATTRIARVSKTRPIDGIRATFIKKNGLVRLPIDHVLVPPDWNARATVTGQNGSDHEAVLAEINVGRSVGG